LRPISKFSAQKNLGRRRGFDLPDSREDQYFATADRDPANTFQDLQDTAMTDQDTILKAFADLQQIAAAYIEPDPVLSAGSFRFGNRPRNHEATVQKMIGHRQ
jgi:hypothetical protein